MKLIEALEKIELAKPGKARLEVLKKAILSEGRTLFFFASGESHEYRFVRDYFLAALDPSITFGVKKIDSKYAPASGNGGGREALLLKLADKLKARELTGNAALLEIEEFLNSCNELEEKWARRLLRRDLKLGIDAKSFNKVSPVKIALFGVPLAEDYAKLKKKPSKGSWVIQPKFDGARTVAYIDFDEKTVELYSRTGKRWGNFKSIEHSLVEWMGGPELRIGRWVLDGEVLSEVDGKTDFQALQHTMMRKDGVEDGKLSYVVFGARAMHDWFHQDFSSYRDHLQTAHSWFGDYGRPERVVCVPILGRLRGYDLDLLGATLETSCRKALEDGYEGVMLRNLDAPVELKRTKNLIKYKMFQDAEAKVVDVVEGQGRLAGTLGALVCEATHPTDEDCDVRFEIGTGFTDAQRAEIWNDACKIRGGEYRAIQGKYVSYKYQELTKDGIPRFPVFKGLRSEDDFDIKRIT